MKTVRIVSALLLLAVLIFSGCQVAGELNTKAEKVEALEGTFLVTHIAATDRNIALGLGSRAAVPSSAISAGISLSSLPAAGTVSDYPEQGETSTYSIVAAPAVASNAYLVTVTTSYGGGWQNGVRSSSTESYYIRDNTVLGDNQPNAIYDQADPIVNASGATEPLYRVSNRTVFKTKFIQGKPYDSSRDETIVSTSSDGSGYDSFASASLDSGWTFVPTPKASGVNWSSKVTYAQEIPAGALALDLVFSSKSTLYYLEGVRYYTEVGSASDHEASSLSIERVFDQAGGAGKLLATVVTIDTYTRAANAAGPSTVVSKATYSTSSGSLTATKSGTETSVPLI